MNNDITRLIEVANELLQDGASAASTSEQIAAAFILNNMTLLPYQYDDVIYAWQRLGNQWQGYVTDIKEQHMALIVKRDTDNMAHLDNSP